MKTKTTNPHAWFFAYVNNLEGYNKEFAKVIRSGIILEYTDGLTDSLSELYSEHTTTYIRMKKELVAQSLNKLDNMRKRLIAVLFSFLKDSKERPTMQYVKTVACKAAKADSFNSIPLNTLKHLYRVFGEKDMKNIPPDERELIRSIFREEYKN